MAVHVVFGLLPFLVREPDMSLVPNPAFESLDDADLLKLLRQGVASRIQHKLHPDPVTADLVGDTVYDDAEPPTDALEAYADAIGLAPVQSMTETLRQVHLPAPILWDVAAAVTQVGAGENLATVDALAAALRAPLTELERDPDTVPMPESFQALTSAGVIADGVNGMYNTLAGDAAEDVAGAVLGDWAARLSRAGQVDADEPMSVESFYRLSLPDRYQMTWRMWILDIVVRATTST